MICISQLSSVYGIFFLKVLCAESCRDASQTGQGVGASDRSWALRSRDQQSKKAHEAFLLLPTSDGGGPGVTGRFTSFVGE